MDILAAIILGIVQGATEFLPVSSTGHLVIASKLFDLDRAFAFDVVLNIGTLAALAWFTRDRLAATTRDFRSGDRGLLLKVALATMPAAAAGYLLEDKIAGLGDKTWLVSVMLIAIGVVMVLARERAVSPLEAKDISYFIAGVIGIAQVLALIPGTSRSGITILAGLMLGLGVKAAAEFSFLLALPIVAGATFKTLLGREGIELLSSSFSAIMIGNLVSFTVGLMAISYLLKLLSSSDLRLFGYYRIGLGAVLLALVSVNIL